MPAPLCGDPSQHRLYGEDLAAAELSWFSHGFSRAVLPIAPWRALAARKPRICGAFVMRRRGLEPPPGNPRTRPSTLRVYQFRHRRRWDSRAQRPLAVAEYSSASGLVRPGGSRGRRRGGAQRPGGGRAHDERGEHAAAAERGHATRGEAASTSAPASVLPAAMPTAIPVEVHVKASVIVPVGARSSSIPLAETSVGAIVAPATSRSSAEHGGSPESADGGVAEAPRASAIAEAARRVGGGAERGRWPARRASSRRPRARAGRRSARGGRSCPARRARTPRPRRSTGRRARRPRRARARRGRAARR